MVLSIREVPQTHANEFQCDCNVSHSWLENCFEHGDLKLKQDLKGNSEYFLVALAHFQLSLTFEPQEDQVGRMGGTVLEFPYTITSNNTDWLQRNPAAMSGQFGRIA